VAAFGQILCFGELYAKVADSGQTLFGKFLSKFCGFWPNYILASFSQKWRILAKLGGFSPKFLIGKFWLILTLLCRSLLFSTDVH
jgi:hypothetical protein